MSQQIKFKSTTLKFDTKKFALEADQKLKELFYGAARAFLIATVSRIPIRTGFLRGAFSTLEDVVGPGGAGPSGRRPPLLKEYYYPGVGRKVLKTVRSGRKFATQGVRTIISKTPSRVTTSPASHNFTFVYVVDIRYLGINDINYGWQSWNAGIRAFQKYIDTHFAQMFPDITKFMVKQIIGTRSV